RQGLYPGCACGRAGRNRRSACAHRGGSVIGSSAKESRSGKAKTARKKTATKSGTASRKRQAPRGDRRVQRVRRWLVNPLSYLPPAVNDFLLRRVVEAAGVLLMLVSGFGLLAVMSWSADDPSLNNATTRAPENWMGLPGAYVADVLLQTLGLASILLQIGRAHV